MNTSRVNRLAALVGALVVLLAVVSTALAVTKRGDARPNRIAGTSRADRFRLRAMCAAFSPQPATCGNRLVAAG